MIKRTILFLLAFTQICVAQVDSIKLQWDGSADPMDSTYDCYIREDLPTRNSGDLTVLDVGQVSGAIFNSPIRWPSVYDTLANAGLSAAWCDSFKIQLYCLSFGSSQAETLVVYGLDAHFAEGAGHDAVGDTAADASWNYRDKAGPGSSDTLWTTAGGDYTDSVGYFIVTTSSTFYTSSSCDGTLLQSWATAYANNKGIILHCRDDVTSSNYKQFASRQFVTVADRPMLIIYGSSKDTGPIRGGGVYGGGLNGGG